MKHYDKAKTPLLRRLALLRGDIALNDGEGEPKDDITGIPTARPASEKALQQLLLTVQGVGDWIG
jgi:hypothetical protein